MTMQKNNGIFAILSYVVSLAVCIGLLMLSACAVGGSLVGDGSVGAPYQIADADDLAVFRDLVNATPSSTANAVLTADIDLENQEWKRIYPDSGYITEAYAGTFDGAYHTIKGLNVRGSDIDQGLFGAIGLATVDGKTVTALIKNLAVEGTVVSSNNYVGGIVGRINAGSLVNCSFAGTVSSSKDRANIGGLVGYINGDKPANKPTVVLAGCVNRAQVLTAQKGDGTFAQNTVAGGIVGYAKYAEMTDCYNSATVSGTSRSGGIAGQMQNNVTAKNCYNIGDVASASYGELAGFLYSSSSFENSFYQETAIGGGTGSLTACGAITDAETLLAALGTAYFADTSCKNGGYPVLAWETGGTPSASNPAIGLSDVVLPVTAGNEHPTAAVTVTYRDMDATPVVWSMVSGETVVELVTPENAGENNATVVLRVLTPGKAVIQAETKDGAYRATAAVLAIPQITTRKIGGTPAVGFTVTAEIAVLGGKEYDYEAYPELLFQWKYLTGEEYLAGKTGFDSYHDIPHATARSFTLPEWLEGCYLSYTVTLAGTNESPSSPVVVSSHAKGVLDTDRSALSLDNASAVKQNQTLLLPTVGENGSVITWASTEPNVIDADTGVITLPKEDIHTVLLTATLSYEGLTVTKEFPFTVYSEQAMKDELADRQKRLKKALEAVRREGSLKPVYGKDTNVIAMLADRFAAAGETVSLAITGVETIHDGAAIAPDGTITYFFADPKTAPSVHNGSLRVTFDISLDQAHLTYGITVVVPWDRARVEALMREEIAAGIVLENTENLTENLTLPAVIDGKTYALVSWSSSDEGAVSIQEGANKTLPYSGIVHRGMTDRRASLTAAVTFGFTSVGEPDIVLYKTFDVTVAKLDDKALDQMRTSLAEKLEQGFSQVGLRNAFTGQQLVETDGVYEVDGDILYPTAQDFGIDGASIAVTLTSDRESVIASAPVNNAARTEVLRPMVGEEPARVTVTVTLTDKLSGVSASRTILFAVLPLTQEEIDAEKQLLNKVLESYFEGIRGANTDKGNIRFDLKPFVEVYARDQELVWVYDASKTVGHGIVPTALDNWQELEAWRLFRSSNAAVISHENLLVTKMNQPKSVTVDSVLSSETLGKYGRLYQENPELYAQYAPLADLYQQPVSAELVVRGRYTASGVSDPVPVEETATVTFTLKTDKTAWIDALKVKDLPDGTTVFDVFTKVLDEKGYTYNNKGGYIASITAPDGTTLGEMSDGPYSGWLYKVNGTMPDVMMSAYGVRNGDKISVYYTKNFMEEFDSGSGSSGGSPSSADPSESEKTDESKDTDQTEKPDETKPSEEAEANQPEQDTPKASEPKPQAPSFTDIDGHWASESIAKAAAKGWMNGVSDTAFAPDGILSRAMFVTVLYRISGSPTVETTAAFADVAAETWYAQAVTWAVKVGIVKGISETEFAPDRALTREQMVLMLYRYAAQESDSCEPTAFTDIDGLSDEAVKAIAWAFAKGVITGMTETTFAPNESATRAQAATIFVRMAEQ